MWLKFFWETEMQRNIFKHNIVRCWAMMCSTSYEQHIRKHNKQMIDKLLKCA